MINIPDKQLISLYEDFDLEELEYLSDCPECIETGEEYQTDEVIGEHIRAIEFLIKKKS